MSSAESDLDWQAFAYWADEMSPAERTRFEALLEDNQLAREALARVVELSHAVIAVESLAAAPSKCEPARRSRRAIAWGAGAAVSALALLAGFMIGQRPSTNPAPHTAASRPIDPDLASAWTDIRSNWSNLATWQQSASADPSSDTTEADDASEHQTGTDWDSADLETPSWMTAALLDQSDVSDDAMDELPDNDSVPGGSSKES